MEPMAKGCAIQCRVVEGRLVVCTACRRLCTVQLNTVHPIELCHQYSYLLCTLVT